MPDHKTKGTKPGKLANLDNLAAALKTAERAFGASDELDDIRDQLVAKIGLHISSKFHMGWELSRYKDALPHGQWLPMVDIIALHTPQRPRSLKRSRNERRGTP
jgi:hypothetical protein